MSRIVSLIVAVDRAGAIGVRGGMLFHVPSDLRHFKAITMGKPIVMGRRTWESLPGGALPGRHNIVVTRNRDYKVEGATVARSLDEAIGLAGQVPEVMVIGGGEIYREALPVASRVYLTKIDAEATEADTYFPTLPAGEWTESEMAPPAIDSRSGLMVHFLRYDRLHGR